MISLEMIGFYSDESGSQSYPIGIMKWFYPNKGNFIAVVSNLSSHSIGGQLVAAMRRRCRVPIERLTAPSFVTGVDFSDHLNYWKADYDAIMLTDTAFLRNDNYHEKTDTPDTLNFSIMADVITGVFFGITHL
jgi:hypothetical protein